MSLSKKFTYGGMFVGSALGWYLPVLIGWNISFFTKFFLSIIFGIIGVIIGYFLLNYLRRKF